MDSRQVLAKGNIVKVINEDHPSHGAIGFVRTVVSPDLYQVKLMGDKFLFLLKEEIELWLDVNAEMI